MAPEFRALVATHSRHRNKSPKDHEQWAAINAAAPWVDRELNPLELAEWIQQGLAWTACLLGGRSHSEDSVVASNLIVLDIDGDLTLEAFWAIPAVQRHCLFTATSCSHTPDEHRFRALFAVEAHEEVDLHGAIYDLWVDRLGIQLKDNCGRKPERLWYGNDRAELRYGGGEPIPWDLVEQARDNLKAARAALPRTSPTNPEDLALDLRRAVVCFEQLLRPSVDGDFSGGYWKELLLAAAATGDEAVQQAFLQWHHRGHHSKTQTQVRRRLQRSRSRMTPGEGAGKILKLAKEQHGQLWWRLLPQELWYGQGGGGLTPPTVLGRSRSFSDIAPLGASRTPDVVPPVAELEKLAAHARHTPLGVSPALESAAAQVPAAPVAPPTLDQQLRQLYFLRAHDQLVIGDDIRPVLEHEFTALDRELLGALLAHPGYCNQISEVEGDLLKLFRREHSFRQKTRARVASFKLTGHGRRRAQWLVPNFLIVGGEHVLYAKGGVGKTTLALHMARAITGDPEINRFLDSGVYNNQPLWQRNPILFIGTDMHGSAEEMTNAYLEDFGLAGRDFLNQVEWWFQDDEAGTPPWMLCLKDLVQLYQYLQEQTDKGTPVAAVFIDSMKAVCPDHLLVGQQGFKDYIKLVKDICKKFNAALIWVHHARGDGSGAQGIQRITEESDANFHLKRDEKTKQLTLEVEKIRGGRAREIPLSLFTAAGPRVTELLPGDEDDGDLGKGNRERAVLEVLADGFRSYRLHATGSLEFIEKNYPGMKLKEIMDAIKSNPRYRTTGFGKTSLQMTIADLKTAGRITGKNTYRLSSNFQPLLDQQGALLDDDALDGPDPEPDLPGW